MSDIDRIEAADIYLVGAFICFAVGGNIAGSSLLGLAAMFCFRKGFAKGLKNEK